MSTRSAGPTSAPPSARLPDGVLVRLAVHHGAWAEDLPPVPEGFAVTVSFSDDDDADLHGSALALLGYRCVGVVPTGLTVPGAGLLVPYALLEAHPAWWQVLQDKADRIFNLGFGPVARALAPLLDLHAAAGRAEPLPT